MVRRLVYMVLIVGALWCVLPQSLAQPVPERKIPLATQGKDFWFMLPRTYSDMSETFLRVLVVSERDCEVTISNDRLGFQTSLHIFARMNCGPDVNYFDLPRNYSWITDTLLPDLPMEQQPLAQPSNWGAFHLTSTDTVAVFVGAISSGGNTGVSNVLPTELLRDEYVLQSFPMQIPCPDTDSYNRPQSFSILAIEDSTIVDMVLTDSTLIGYHRGDTLSVRLDRGQMYMLRSDQSDTIYKRAIRLVPLGPRHPGQYFRMPDSVADLTGTLVRARDGKRIAVFSQSAEAFVPVEKYDELLRRYSDLIFEQLLPTYYGGTEFVTLPQPSETVPHSFADTNYLQLVALHDSTEISVRGSHYITLNAYQSYVMPQMLSDTALVVNTSRPVMAHLYTSTQWNSVGLKEVCPSQMWLTPVEHWMSGTSYLGTYNLIRWVPDLARDRHMFRMVVVMDGDRVEEFRHDLTRYDTIFYHRIPFSNYRWGLVDYEWFIWNDHGQGPHVLQTDSAKYMALFSSMERYQGFACNTSFKQPAGVFLRCEGVNVDSLSAFRNCFDQPLTLQIEAQYPMADSVFWYWGDGTVDSMLYQGRTSATHQYQPGRYQLDAVVRYEWDGTFTRKPDTVSFPVEILSHVDSTLDMEVCEGTDLFRTLLLDTSGTYIYEAMRSQNECDTTFQIHFTTCRRCAVRTDTVALDNLPYRYLGQVFDGAVYNHKIYVPDPYDECDSIVNYTLIIVLDPSEPPLDTVGLWVPNVFTPSLESNNTFRIRSANISAIEVWVYDRMGRQVAHFDGMTESWDGTHQGQNCPQGAYAYRIRYIGTSCANWRVSQGTVTLIR